MHELDASLQMKQYESCNHHYCDLPEDILASACTALKRGMNQDFIQNVRGSVIKFKFKYLHGNFPHEEFLTIVQAL